LVDSQKRNKLESKKRRVSSSGSPKESKVSDFGILKHGAHLPGEMWTLMKNQCCKKKSEMKDKAQSGDSDSSVYNQ